MPVLIRNKAGWTMFTESYEIIIFAKVISIFAKETAMAIMFLKAVLF